MSIFWNFIHNRFLSFLCLSIRKMLLPPLMGFSSFVVGASRTSSSGIAKFMLRSYKWLARRLRKMSSPLDQRKFMVVWERKELHSWRSCIANFVRITGASPAMLVVLYIVWKNLSFRPYFPTIRRLSRVNSSRRAVIELCDGIMSLSMWRMISFEAWAQSLKRRARPRIGSSDELSMWDSIRLERGGMVEGVECETTISDIDG